MSRISHYTRRQVCQLGLSGLAGLTMLDIGAGLAGCGGSGSGSETLQLVFWGPASRNKLTRKAIALFQNAHSTIKINSSFADFTSYWNKLDTEIASGSVPDLMQMDMAYVALYVKEGILLDLTSLIADKTIDLADFDQNLLQNSEDNGKVYGIPLGGNYECLVYDTTLIQKAGVGTPSTSMTWQDYGNYVGELAKALAAEHIFGTVDASGAIDIFEIWIRQRGKELWTPDGKVAFSVEDVADWFNYWSALRQSGACASAEVQASVANASGPATSLLIKGNVVFDVAHSNQFDSYQALTTHPLALEQTPTGPGPGLYLKPSMLMSIAAKSKYAKDAAAFINFIINDPQGVRALGLDRGVPGSPKARAALMSTLTAPQKAILAYVNAVANSNQNRPKTILDPPGAGQVQNILSRVAQAVAFGKTSVSAGAATFYSDAQKALA
jgi:multiple sugar transport system substrate-binding protein